MAVIPAPGTPATTRAPRGERERLVYLDNLKTVFVAAIVVGHAAITYGTFGSWIYEEKAFGSVPLKAVSLLTIIGWQFAVGLFFLVSGYLTPPSFERKGFGRFTLDRLSRLGIPLVVYVVVIMPLTRYAIYRVTTPGPFESLIDFARHENWIMNLGPMWFVAFLLVFSLAYAGWRTLWPPNPLSRPLRARDLILLALAICAGSAVLRLIWPFDPRQALNLHVGLWVQYPLMFWFGALSAERGWLRSLPDRAWRWCGLTALTAALAVAILVAVSGALTGQGHVPLRLWPWPDLGLALIEGPIAVTASLWTLEYFRRRENHQGRTVRAASRSAYGAFMIQAPVLAGLALAMRSALIPVELKFVVLAVGATLLSFVASWLLIRFTAVNRVV